ncbi:MAG: undecaprenyl diphosphate synthase family protein [Actinomycetes bacterium]
MRKLFNRRKQVVETAVDSDDSLLHIAIAGGSLCEWERFGSHWETRIQELTELMSPFGVQFLSLYPHGPDIDDHKVQTQTFDRQVIINGMNVTVHSSTDGRERICLALQEFSVTEIVTESLLDQRLFGGAGDPDLVVVLGPANCLPRSLVWELAYSEIVFVEQSWTMLSLEKIQSAIQEYFLRHRRFGGVDT